MPIPTPKRKTSLKRLEYMRAYYKTEKYLSWQRNHRAKNAERYREYDRLRYLRSKKKDALGGAKSE